MKAVFIRPKFDEASNYSYLWCQRLIDTVKGKLEQCIDLAGEQATRENTEKALKANPEADFVFYNHGNSEGLAEQGGEGYVIDKKNDDLLIGRVAYSMACLWASDGGADAYRKGAKVVVGYIKEFAFITDDEELFCYAANSGFIAHVNGEKDWAKIKQIMIDAFNEAIAKTENPWSRVWLSWDRDNLRIYAEGVDTPETKCAFRKLAIKIFGPKIGWRISRKHALGWIFYLVGFGIALHDFSHQVFELKGTPLSLEGGYIGFALCFIGFIFLVSDYVKWLKRSSSF